MPLDATCFFWRNQGEILCKFESKDEKAIFVGYTIAGKAYIVYNLKLNILMESIHVFFDDKKKNVLLDDGNHELLHFENEVNTDQDDSDDDNVVCKRNQISVDIIPRTNNLLVDHVVSTDNVSTTNPSTNIQNSISRSMELGEFLTTFQQEFKIRIKIKFMKMKFSHHQDQTFYHKGSGPRVIPFN